MISHFYHQQEIITSMHLKKMTLVISENYQESPSFAKFKC